MTVHFQRVYRWVVSHAPIICHYHHADNNLKERVGMFSRLAIILLIVFLLVALGLPIYMVGRNLYFPMEAAEYLYALGRLFGLIAFFALTLQYLWTAKMSLFEKLISYDRRVALHRSFGFLGILLLSLHPILILGSYALQGYPFIVTLPLSLGFISFILLLLIAGSTFLGRIWGVKYETWKKFHWITFPVLTLAVFHSLVLGSDLYGFFRYFWIALWAVHLFLLLSKLIHKVKAWIRKYRVLDVRNESSNVNTVIIEKPIKRHLPGQFGFLSLQFDEHWDAWHPFSLTSTESDEYLSMTIKGLGDFSNQISEVKAGDSAKLDTGYGGFSPKLVKDSRYVLIAGGLALRPFMAY